MPSPSGDTRLKHTPPSFSPATLGRAVPCSRLLPSVSTYMRTLAGVRPENKLTLIEMAERVNRRALPEVKIIDMRKELLRGNRSIFSGELKQVLDETFRAGEQAILFLNRRGYSTFVSCRNCGYVEKCDNCDVTMTYHQYDNMLRCHYCGAERRPHTICPSCGSPYIKYFGVGTQKVEEELNALFPDAGVVRMDADTTSGKDAHARLLHEFGTGAVIFLCKIISFGGIQWIRE